MTAAVTTETQIRDAYLRLVRPDNRWVGIAAIRTALPEIGRAEMDKALRDLAIQPDVYIIPVANLKSLTEDDRAAALRLGGEDNHAIMIEAR